MKYILFLIVLFFSSFNLEYREKYVCHTIVESPTLATCLVLVVRADSKKEAERKFCEHIRRKELQLGAKEKSKDTYVISTLKNASLIEPPSEPIQFYKE